MFSDSFEDANAWTPVAGTWTIEDDVGDSVYSQNDVTDINDQHWALAGDYGWDDYIFEAKAKGIEGHYSSHGTNTWVGLVFRAKDDTHFYEYYFRTTTQDIIVVEHDGGPRTVISGPVPFTCANDNWYKLKVIAEGNSFRFFVDDVEISGLAFTDTTNPFMTGKIGLYVWDGTHAHFDDVLVLGYQYQCNLHTKELQMESGEYMITVSGDGYEFQYPFELVEPGKAKGKSK